MGSLLIIQHEKDYSEQQNEVQTWGSGTLPLFLDYDLIIAEFPSSDVITDDLLFEYEQARRAGCHFIWLINDEADKAFMSAVLQTRVIGLGRSGRNITLVSEFADFEPILTGFNFSFEVSKSWEVVAFSRHENVAVAALDRHDSKGATLVLPGNHVAAADYVKLAQAVENLARHRERVYDNFTGFFYKALAVIFIATVMVTSARYLQRHNNIEIMSNESMRITEYPFSSTYNARFIDGFGDDLEPIVKFQEIEKYAGKHGAASLLALYRDLGYFNREQQFFRYLVESDYPGISRNRLVRYLRDMFAEADRHMRKNEYQMARYRAQTFLNLSYDVPWEEHLFGFNYYLNRAQKIVDLTSANFLYFDSKKVNQIYESHRGDHEGDISKEGVVDDSLLDNIDYINTAYETRYQDVDDPVQSWQEFINAYPASEKKEEAEFNIIIEYLYKTLDPQVQANVTATEANSYIDYTTKFVARHPVSYLADDALLYAIIMAVKTNRNGRLKQVLHQFYSKYPKSDSARNLSYKISWVNEQRAYFIEDVMAAKQPLTVDDAFEVVKSERFNKALFLSSVRNIEEVGGRNVLEMNAQKLAMAFIKATYRNDF